MLTLTVRLEWQVVIDVNLDLSTFRISGHRRNSARRGVLTADGDLLMALEFRAVGDVL